MNKEPETYEELMRQKRCIELTKYYSLSAEEVEKIYQFLASNPAASIVGNTTGICLLINKGVVEFIPCVKLSPLIDGLEIDNTRIFIINHYSSSGGSGGGGGSSNNNNNNNNNN